MFVGLGAVTAPSTDEFRLGDPVFLGCVPAGFAAIGGMPGVNLDPYTPSVFRFGAQYTEEIAPARIADASVEPGLGPGPVGQKLPRIVEIGDGLGPAHHVGDLQILHHQQVVRLHEPAGVFVVEILALVGDLAVPRRHCLTFGLTILAAPTRAV